MLKVVESREFLGYLICDWCNDKWLLKSGEVVDKWDYEDYFDSKQEAEHFLDMWLDGWEIRQVDEPLRSFWTKTWYIQQGKACKFLNQKGIIESRCDSSWYETKKEAEDVLYKYLSTKFQEKTISNKEDLQKKLDHAVMVLHSAQKAKANVCRDIVEIREEIEQIKKDIKEAEKPKKIYWKDLAIGTVVESLSRPGYYAVVIFSVQERKKQLVGIRGNFLYKTICDCVYFNNVRVVGSLNYYIDWRKE